jgi:DNA helicase-2/ATP-dependent DNA helicase PcrA
MAFVPSKYQKAVYTYITKCKGNAVVDAVAGSGKSTTIVNALKIIPSNKNILFLAFNKSIVEELKKKIGNLSNVEISTLHSLGARACMKKCKSKINSGKYSQYITKRMEDNTLQGEAYEKLSAVDKHNWRNNIYNLFDLARVNLVNDSQSVVELSYKHDIDIVDNEVDVVLELMDWGKKNITEIDFTDMIYFPNVMNIPLAKYDWVFIDECQDLNAAQRELFLKCIKPGGRFIAVGDERQAIYGFSGADADSFKKLRSLPNTVKLPLSICYRCDKDIITLARTIVPQIQSRDNADVGTINRESKIEDVKDGDMILCRITAPLIRLCMKYISQGVKAYVKGRDIGANLCYMIDKTGEETIEGALNAMRREMGKIIGKLIAQKLVSNEEEAKEHPRYVNMNDKVESIEAISEGLIKSSDVIKKIKTIFSDNNGNGICLSTIHKSKGLENDRVFIICEDKMPLRGCMNIPWMAEQEWNLIYVAYTRAKHYLGFIQDFS